jgi:hypothetical protein
MHSVGESLFRSRNFVRSGTDNAPRRERACRRESEERNAQQMRARSEAECIQSKKACYDAPGRGKTSRREKGKIETGRKGEQVAKQYAFSRRKSAMKPPFSRQRNRHCLRKRKNKHQKERVRESHSEE